MRRKDREMDREFGLGIIDNSHYAVLSIVDKHNKAYAVPISPARVGNVLYIHSAREGHKVDLIKHDSRVVLTFVGEVQVPTPIKEEDFLQAKDDNQLASITSKHFTTEFESAIIVGKALILEDPEEKIEGLRAISQKYTPENMKYFDDAVKASIDRTMVIGIEIEEITAKRKKYDVNGDEMKWGRME